MLRWGSALGNRIDSTSTSFSLSLFQGSQCIQTSLQGERQGTAWTPTELRCDMTSAGWEHQHGDRPGDCTKNGFPVAEVRWRSVTSVVWLEKVQKIQPQERQVLLISFLQVCAAKCPKFQDINHQSAIACASWHNVQASSGIWWQRWWGKVAALLRKSFVNFLRTCLQACSFTILLPLCSQAEIQITEDAFTRACSNLSQAKNVLPNFHRNWSV